ncbi:MAG TPA: type 4a pilus biogenesis protein PilO [Methylotenera sp.]|jgi:type IV pilus assembly protein PilO|nr:type 4a pilus biogenesis protein PilO [Methylotenera sp.]HOY86762.1 type 4a pilus biogenesis protein PilO [Methylotenera sp.]HPH08856.1 type 4a pilus biogenesis protein PilO [Methylotenera sp.]HPM49799.1 type 4a pilus biogenesis protein PilO [Methylotenera sp.]HPV32344.1 type 4a pilus biogenesis protein PilO [Methylotenera sp.]
MKLEDFNNIDFKNAGSLPGAVKAVLLLILFLVIFAVGYWYFWTEAFDALEAEKVKEQELRTVFLDKKAQAINLEGYRQQMVEIEKTFGALLKQLPDKSQMDGLLTDINQAGLARGLEFELFKPGQETQTEFYAEMPISIRVLGNYHDLGAFATDISKLSRIVTLGDISIIASSKEGKQATNANLIMEATAKTYRYLDASEIAAKKKADSEALAKKG